MNRDEESGLERDTIDGSNPRARGSTPREILLRSPEASMSGLESSHPDRIRVVVTHQEEIEARHADLFIDVRGATLVASREAIGQTREIARLTSELGLRGVSVEQVEVRAVRAQPSGGLLNRSTASIYSVRVRRVPLAILTDILGTITAQKTSKLRAILWRYDDGEETRDLWIERSIERANERARRIAATLGVRLVGVYNLTTRLVDPDRREEGEASPYRHGILAHADYDLGKLVGMTLRPTRTIEVTAAVDYRISPFEQD